MVSNWSIASQFDPFGRGVISLSSVVYFLMIIVVGLYLSMVLIGARHWYGGRDGHSLLGHYLLRIDCADRDRAGQSRRSSPATTVIRVRHDAAAKSARCRPTPSVWCGNWSRNSRSTWMRLSAAKYPEQYVKTRLNLLSMLKEFEAMAGGKIRVNIHNNLEPFSEEAALAEEQFGIRPEQIRIRPRGAIADEEMILGAAFRCGLQKVVVPFFDYGIPVEYELIRSINTVAQTERQDDRRRADRCQLVRRVHVCRRPAPATASSGHHRRTRKTV